MIFFDRKISADVAQERGLVTQVFSDSTFDDEVNAKLQEIAKLPRKVCLIIMTHGGKMNQNVHNLIMSYSLKTNENQNDISD